MGGNGDTQASKGGKLQKAAEKHEAESDKQQAVDQVEKECPLAELKVVVKTSAGKAVGLARVAVEPAGGGAPLATGNTDQKDGQHDFGKFQPGKYKVKAEKDWHICPSTKAEHAEQDNVELKEREKKTVPLTLDPIEIHMYLDSDRDGAADPTRDHAEEWEWGKGKFGAIILCNNDDDYDAAKKNASDNADQKVNEHNDDKEVAPLAFRRTGPEPPSSWKAKLEVGAAHQARIRVFETRTKGAAQVLGKDKGTRYDFPDLKFQQREMGMEATQYAGKYPAGGDWNGEVELTFTLTAPGGKKREEKGKVRVAPWMMMHHLQEARRVYVVNCTYAGYADFRTRLVAALPGGLALDTTLAGADIWAQDCMEVGFSSLPDHVIHAIVRSPQSRTLSASTTDLRDKDIGHETPVTPLGNPTKDSFGNLELTPPCKAGGKDYPFGRIYYGHDAGAGPGRTMKTDFQDFLKAQVVQKPFTLPTDWLGVGHVDEMLTFVPDGAGSFKCFVASPRRAMAILRGMGKCKKKRTKMLIGRVLEDHTDTPHSVETTVKDFLLNGLATGEKASDIRAANTTAQAKLDEAVTKLKAEIGLRDDQVVEVPVLFRDNPLFPGFASAMTADLVNMLVVNGACIYPMPYGPVVKGEDLFDEAMKKELTALGLTPKPIDDWDTYHRREGEVHCGTNTMRKAEITKWWEFEP